MNRAFVALTPASALVAVACGALAFGALACGDSGTGGSDTGGGGAGATGGGGEAPGGNGTGASGGAPPECEEPEGTPGAPVVTDVGNILAFADDETGANIADTPFFMCGWDLCPPSQSSNMIGQVSFDLTNVGMLDRPLFKPVDSLELVKVGYLYTGQAQLNGVFPRIVDSGEAIVGGATVTADDVELTLPAGGIAEFPLIYDDEAKQTFRAKVVSDAAVVQQITGEAGYAMVVGLGPNSALLCPPASLTVPNDAGLGAGTAVEFVAQELETSEAFAPYGEWAPIADGVVSGDGATITFAEMPVLLTGAIRIK